MKTETKKSIFWGLVVGVFILGPCFHFFVNERGYETPDNLKEIVPRTVDAVIYGKEDPVGGNPSVYERLMSYNLLGGNQDPEEAQAEADAEAERLANWKANFPYQPTTDPDVVMTERTLQINRSASPPADVHGFLKEFFQNEARFTSQFEQLYHILEEHGRGDNPVAAGNIFNSLWRYHDYSAKDPDEISGRYSNRLGRYKTNGEAAETFFEGIVYELHAERVWPDREFMPEDEAMAIRDRIIDEIEGMDEIPHPRFTYRNDPDLDVGDSPLVISAGWQEAYDKWDRSWKQRELHELQNRQMGVGEGNVLMANGRPVISAEGDGFFANITTPDGFQVPLIRGGNGEVIIPTPVEIEEMKANGEGEWVELPERPAPPPPQLTEMVNAGGLADDPRSRPSARIVVCLSLFLFFKLSTATLQQNAHCRSFLCLARPAKPSSANRDERAASKILWQPPNQERSPNALFLFFSFEIPALHSFGMTGFILVCADFLLFKVFGCGV